MCAGPLMLYVFTLNRHSEKYFLSVQDVCLLFLRNDDRKCFGRNIFASKREKILYDYLFSFILLKQLNSRKIPVDVDKLKQHLHHHLAQRICL